MPKVHIVHRNHDTLQQLSSIFEKEDISSERYATLVEFQHRWEPSEDSIILLGDGYVDASQCEAAEFVKQTANGNMRLVALVPESNRQRSQGLQDVKDRGFHDYIFLPVKRRTAVLVVQRFLQEFVGLEPGDIRATAKLGPYHVDLADRKIFDDQENEVQISPKEYQAISIFIDNPSEIVRREDIRDFLSPERTITTRSIDTLICRIRRKLPARGKSHFIRTVSKIGYVYEPDWRDMPSIILRD